MRVGARRDAREQGQVEDRNGRVPWARRPPPVGFSNGTAATISGALTAHGSARHGVHGGESPRTRRQPPPRRLITREMRSATTAAAGERSPPLRAAVVESGRGRRSLGRARQDECATGARDGGCGLLHHRRRRGKPDRNPHDHRRGGVPQRENEPAVIVPVDRSDVRGLDRVAPRGRRRCMVRDRSDVRELSVLGTAYVLDRQLVPPSRKLGEPDRRNAGYGEQTSGQLRSKQIALVIASTRKHGRVSSQLRGT